MKTKMLFVITVAFTTLVSCKKNTLVEVVDVPATPIVVIKNETGKSNVDDVKATDGTFEMFKLPYAYKDLEPNFDATTTEIHYSKHHLGFVNNLNKAVVNTKFAAMTLNDILKNLNLSDSDLRNNAGGFYNHNFFWGNISPNSGGQPDGILLEAIIKDFGDFDNFRSQFTETSLRLIGSGWTWLVSDKYGKLKIITTQNNDNSLMKGLGISGTPILNLDMWEHAYYLKFQNRKRDYVNTYFSVVNWKEASLKYEAFPKTTVSKSVLTSPSTQSETDIVEPIEIPSPKPE